MVYRNYDDKPKKQNHVAVAVIGTAVLITLLIAGLIALTSSLDLWWKIYITTITIWLMYGTFSMLKKALKGIDYCIECGRPYK